MNQSIPGAGIDGNGEILTGELAQTHPRADIKDPAIQLLTIDATAAYLGLSTRTVHRMIKEQRLVAYKVGREWRIRTDDLLRCAFAKSSVKIEVEVK